MNEHYFGWQVYCILEQGKRELDKLLDDTKNAIRSHHIGQQLTLARWFTMMAEAAAYDKAEREFLDKQSKLMDGLQWGDNPLDKAFWRVNLSK